MPKNGDILKIILNDLVIGTNIKVASHWCSRLKGLLGTVNLSKDSGLWIIPCNSIHMIGMLYSIDAIFLDKDNVVCKKVNNIRPFGFSFGGKNAYSVIELPVNFLKEFDIKIGQPINISKE